MSIASAALSFAVTFVALSFGPASLRPFALPGALAVSALVSVARWAWLAAQRRRAQAERELSYEIVVPWTAVRTYAGTDGVWEVQFKPSWFSSARALFFAIDRDDTTALIAAFDASRARPVHRPRIPPRLVAALVLILASCIGGALWVEQRHVSTSPGLLMLVAPRDQGLHFTLDDVSYELTPGRHFTDRVRPGHHVVQVGERRFELDVTGSRSEFFLPLGRCFALVDVRDALYGKKRGAPSVLQRIGSGEVVDVYPHHEEWIHFEDEPLDQAINSKLRDYPLMREVACRLLGKSDAELVNALNLVD